jgi:hypothetical protein
VKKKEIVVNSLQDLPSLSSKILKEQVNLAKTYTMDNFFIRSKDKRIVEILCVLIQYLPL